MSQIRTYKNLLKLEKSSISNKFNKIENIDLLIIQSKDLSAFRV